MYQNHRREIRWPLRYLTPSLHIKTVYDLPISWLKDKSVRAIITDLDNTLVPWRDYKVASDLARWFDSLHKHGFKTIIVTNARPSPTIKELSKKLGTQLVVGARKPISSFFYQALKIIDSTPAETCVIGDQVFTDVLGGNIVGCHTVLVDRISEAEFFGTRLIRIFEKLVLKKVQSRT